MKEPVGFEYGWLTWFSRASNRQIADFERKFKAAMDLDANAQFIHWFLEQGLFL